MTNDPSFQRWRELSWRHKLTPAEEADLRAWLAAHPEAQADWEAETALTDALHRMPDVPVATNFTARVLQEVEREARSAARASKGPGWQPSKRWIPRIALASVALAIGLFSMQQIRANYTAKLVRSVEVVSKVSSLPSPAILKDFDAIERLTPQPAAPDEQLLSLLQ
jgi:anti-sigma factor RsiW